MQFQNMFQKIYIRANNNNTNCYYKISILSYLLYDMKFNET